MDAAKEGISKAIAGWKSAMTPGFIKRYQNKKIFVKAFVDKGPHSLTHLLTYLLTHSLTYLLTYLLTYSLTYLLTYSLTHLLTYLLTYSLLTL